MPEREEASNGPAPLEVLDSVHDGVYVTDSRRQITYWNPAAERMTGWSAEDIVGRTCYDDVLCHEDKDGRKLCGEEHCPLHRAIVTGNSSTLPIIVFAQCKDGDRIPVRVSVAPQASSPSVQPTVMGAGASAEPTRTVTPAGQPTRVAIPFLAR